MLEKDIQKACKHRLDYWQSVGAVIHYDRLNSGKMQLEGRYVQLCKPGTPDLVAYLKNNNTCYVLFMEVKVPGGKQSKDQKSFEDKFNNMANVLYAVITHPNEVDRLIDWITNYTKTKLNSMEI